MYSSKANPTLDNLQAQDNPQTQAQQSSSSYSSSSSSSKRSPSPPPSLAPPTSEISSAMNNPNPPDLRHPLIFPTMAVCPRDWDGIPDKCYYYTAHGSRFNYRFHWALIAEIKEVWFLKYLKLTCEDRDGKRFEIVFSTKDKGDKLFDYAKEGYTVFILYPHGHDMDTENWGIIQEDDWGIAIVPYSMEEILTLSDKVKAANTLTEDGERTCHACGKTDADLPRCTRCRLFFYCNATCHTNAYKNKNHKADCRMLRNPILKMIFDLDWSVFNERKGCLRFPPLIEYSNSFPKVKTTTTMEREC